MRKKLLLAALAILLFVPGTTGLAQAPNRAGLAIQFPDGQIETTCVEFEEDQISGLELLNRSGLVVKVDHSSGLGAKVCKIEETGCNYPEEDCWCQCQGSPCAYWNYWLLKNGQWVYSPLGAGSRRLGDGDVDGWAWGDGQPPPHISLGEICHGKVEATEATALAFTSPLKTPTYRPTAVQTPWPTATGPASPLSPPTTVMPPPASPTARVFVPATEGQPPPASKTPEPDLPPSPDRYVSLAGILAALGLIVLTIWRRRKGV